MNRVEKAIALHKKGYNCAQSVACAFAEEFGVSEELVFKLVEGFGGGMGSKENVCGAISGAVAVIGLKISSGNPADRTKQKSYELTTELLRRFKEKNGAVVCKEIKGLETKKVLRSCDGCIEDAVLLAEELLGLATNA